VVVVYPIENTTSNIINELAGKYSKYAKNADKSKSFQEIREEAMMAAMKEKYGFSD